ncbi:glutamate receptor 3.1 [Hyalella azteca]|uniref:Glutamate receptor 3.1 n=1 Tax=Hyalella azteca TaxID=294128 RepID=A0A8B7P144_HYAAZ|nr:glutamate receptor 3.1 [Hyalella azteca]
MWTRGFTWTLKIFLSQDLADTPGKGSGRMLGAFWLFISFMIASIYRCNLQAILVNEKIKVPFTSAEEFTHQDEYKITWINGTIYGDTFKLDEPNCLRGRLWSMRDSFQPNAEEAVQAVLDKKVSILAPDMMLIGLLAADFSKFGDCRLAVTSTGLMPSYMTYAYPKNSPLQDAMDQMMLRVVQSGIAPRLIEAGLRNASWCTKPQTSLSDSRPFAPKDFFGIFIIYGIGVTVAFVIFVIEVKMGGGAEKRTDKNQ